MNLRPYQSDCIAAIESALAEHDSALAVLPTGTGKTVLFTWLGRRWPTGRVLVLAHREELVFQAAARVKAVFGEQPDIEMAECKAAPTIYGGSKVVVASVQSLYREGRLGSDVYQPENFGLVIVDEAHHATKGNKTYERILSHFRRNNDCRFLGVTATPDRADGIGLGETFAAVAYRYQLRQAIDDAWLVPIRQQFVTCEHLDFSRAKTKGANGDFTDASLAAIMEEERVLHEVLGPTMEIVGDRPTLIFAASIHHAERAAEILRRHGKAAVAVHGGNTDYACSTETRRHRLRAYHAGDHQFLVGCDVFYEGFDEDRISCVAVARPTKSRARYTQAVGRGTRPLEGIRDMLGDTDDAAVRGRVIAASAKPDLLVLDFVGASTKLKLDLMSTADLLAGEGDSEAVRRAKKKVKESGGSADMREAVEEAARELADEREQQKRQAVTARSEYVAVDVDPFDEAGQYHAEEADRSRKKLATQGQIDYLAKHGIQAERMGRRQASAVIEKVRHCPTLKQKSVLARAGEDVKMSGVKAKVVIDLLAARGWQPRRWKLTKDKWSIRRKDNGGFRALIRDPDRNCKIPVGPEHNTEVECRQFIGECLEQEAGLFTAVA